MTKATVTLFSFNANGDPIGQPLTAEMEYTNLALDDQRLWREKVTLAVGDDIVAGTISIPLFVLDALMRATMEAKMKRDRLVGNKPLITK